MDDSTLIEIGSSDEEGSVEILYLQYTDETENYEKTKQNISNKQSITESPKKPKGDGWF